MTSWWQPVLGGVGGVLAAIIAGSFAVRNARKTPHETLKTLIEITEKAEGRIRPEDQAVLIAACHREILRIDRLNQARVEGFWKYWKERLRQAVAVDPAVTPEISLGLGLPSVGVKVNWRLLWRSLRAKKGSRPSQEPKQVGEVTPNVASTAQEGTAE